MAAQAANPRTFQMPSHGWGMLKRLIRAYGAAQDNDSSNVEAVAKLAGVPRPSVSSNNNFLRSIGVLELDKPKLTPLGVNLSTGISLDNQSIITEALQEVVRSTPIFSQLLNTVRARGSMDISTFKGQVILAAGLKPNSPGLGTIKTLTDLFEESGAVEIRDDKIFVAGQPRANDYGPLHAPADAQKDTAAGEPKQRHRDDSTSGPTNAWAEQLLSKFPQFDPAWSDDVKLKWFDAFDRLMKGRGM